MVSEKDVDPGRFFPAVSLVQFLPSLLASLLPSSYRYRPEGEALREASEARRQARDERKEMRDRRLAREPDGTGHNQRNS